MLIEYEPDVGVLAIVKNAYPVKDGLKAGHFRWNARTRDWQREFKADIEEVILRAALDAGVRQMAQDNIAVLKPRYPHLFV